MRYGFGNEWISSILKMQILGEGKILLLGVMLIFSLKYQYFY